MIESLANDRVVVKQQINDAYAIIDYKTGQVEQTIPHPRSRKVYEFLGSAQKGGHIVISSRKNIRIIDATDPTHVEDIHPPSIPFASVAYSASAGAFVFGLEDGRLQYWRFEDLLKSGPMGESGHATFPLTGA